MVRISDIIDKMLENNPDADIDLIDRAYIYSARVHDGQVRLSGEPYLSHPLEVSAILADMNLDAVSIAAGLLHDVVEDTHATITEISDIFGPDVAHIVSGVTKLTKVETHSAHQRHAESIRKMILAMADDIRVILIKLADRLHNMRTLGFHKSDKKKREISQETLDIYASIASRLGIYWMKRELEDSSFMYIMPEEYARIKGLVSKDKEEREHYVETVMGMIKKEMKAAGIKCEVLGRYKHFYSIYQKMITQNLEFEDVYDIVAFRIILDTKSQCYEALGILHALWKPIDVKFKDYIGRPKPNMYQSLHTTVIGPYGERVEIQIRTWEMDRVAKSGIAAHWSYKEGKKLDKSISEKFAWIQNLIENQANIENPDEFLESVRIDLFPDEVYVFTPQGQVKSLVKGATPVDFAYLIHTEVGNQCIGAKVNGRMVPLRSELNTGDIVEIITNKNHQPSKDWLSFVKTVKARSRIRQWIKTQEKERSISLGREMCEKAFRKYKLNYNDVVKSDEMEAVIADFGFKSLDDLIANVGYGKITPLQVVRKFMRKPPTEEEKDDSLFDKIIHRVRKKKARTGVTVKGIDDVLVRFGKCCQPVPGDPIIGYITQGRGVTVHRVNCVNALQLNPERQIEVEWNDTTPEETYPVKIHIHSFDRVGLLADLASNISKNGANILNVHSEIRDNNTVDSIFTLAIKDTNHLNRVLSDLKKVKQISKVERIES
ncbi:MULTISPECIES: RelA/SpoT family protein [Desulfococcus]|uniref:Metal dependent phosphohydrolase n=1 Tax=Desulfococcus multivorans DSM 2059 TaxID=1121405 RepID=S7TZK2_DESML|nr:bifunctional (p)ppGpp synthetase/guanosine-3',5'-bis(diphosphate) 3'-pyrophosphohydrolase [Desulfococcus multivorans]AOY58313.1 RelA: GTP pyrophosphokinase [Desulfococcus multivorans]AQV00648.1 GTP pyrophosphokinase [Desulfococcus multivorans]EPR42611.1 metal dependent phosphohydrolase [Desulfococcus multivorans DSM 2059]SKA17917.1 GTP pyrophosphokinase [Desulfococcus multivorans DSM 2059]